jgi:hypothetical protein
MFWQRSTASSSVSRPKKGTYRAVRGFNEPSRLVKVIQIVQIGFDSRTVALTDLTTLGVAVGATVLSVEVAIEDQ